MDKLYESTAKHIFEAIQENFLNSIDELILKDDESINYLCELIKGNWTTPWEDLPEDLRGEYIRIAYIFKDMEQEDIKYQSPSSGFVILKGGK